MSIPEQTPPTPTTHHSCLQTSSLIYLWGEGEGKSWHLLTCADHSRKNLPWLPFVFNVGPFNMQSPPILSNVKYLLTLVSRHPICVHGQLDCISSQSPFTRSIWARIWVRKIEANIKSETYYSSVTVQELAVKNPFTHLRVRCRTNLNLESLFRGVCKKSRTPERRKPLEA